MRKILFNQSEFNSQDLINNIISIYNNIIKMENTVEKDVYEVIKYVKTFYDSERFFPTKDQIKEEFPDFEFIESKFDNEIDFINYIKNKNKKFRDDYRQKLSLKYMEKDLSVDERMDVLDKLTKLELEIQSSRKDEIIEMSNVSIRQLLKNREKIKGGIITNIPDIDEATMGISNGKLCTIMGGPGSFKTSLAINMNYLESMNNENSNSLFINFEIPKDELTFKIAIRHSYGTKINLSILKILKNLIDETDVSYLEQLYEDYLKKRKSKCWLADANDFDMTSLISFKNKLIDEIKEKDLKTIYFDHLHLLRGYRMKGYKDEREMVNDIVSMFRSLSVTYGVRFVLLAQVNKEAMKKVNKNGGKYDMADISEYNAIERDSYYIISLYGNDELKLANNLMFQLLKHRDGQTIMEPTRTFIYPQNFVIGNLGITTTDLLPDIDNINSKSNSNDEYLDLFVD